MRNVFWVLAIAALALPTSAHAECGQFPAGSTDYYDLIVSNDSSLRSIQLELYNPPTADGTAEYSICVDIKTERGTLPRPGECDPLSVSVFQELDSCSEPCSPGSLEPGMHAVQAVANVANALLATKSV